MSSSETREIEMPNSNGPVSWVEIGRVARPHGRKGALFVHLHGDDPGNLNASPRLVLEGTPGRVCFDLGLVAAAGCLSNGRVRLRVHLVGLDTREEAARWAGARVSIPETALQPLPQGEYYWRDLLGLRCLLPDGSELGVVKEIWPTAGSDLLVVRKDEKTWLVPTLRSVLARVDLAGGELWIEPPPGLIEGY